jgi:hypothetical protein
VAVEEIRVRKILVAIMGIISLLGLYSCLGPVVKTDLQSLNENPEDFEGKEVIITAALNTVTENPDAYLYKKIELKGYVVYKEPWSGLYWNFILIDEDGNAVNCDERWYRTDIWIWPLTAVRHARNKNEQLTVVGRFQKGRTLELDWIEYDGQMFDTDFLPPRMYRFSRPCVSAGFASAR